MPSPVVEEGTRGVLVWTVTEVVPLGDSDGTGELIGRTLLGPEGEVAPAVVVSVTGQTVVEMGIVEVTTVVESAGQSVTSAAQLVMVTSLVVKIVEVVIWTEDVITGVDDAEDLVVSLAVGEDDTSDVLAGSTLLGLGPADKEEAVVADVASVTGHTVVEIAIVEVTTVVESAGQSVTSGAQLVMVISLVVNTVEVVIFTGVLTTGVVTGDTEEPGTETDVLILELEPSTTEEEPA